MKRLLYFIAIMLAIFSCKKHYGYDFAEGPEPSCGVAYKTSDLYFTEDATLTFNLRLVYFADSINENAVSCDSVINYLNDFYKSSGIQFTNYKNQGCMLVVNSEIKRDMPSFVKYHLRNFKNDSTITMYVYGDDQPNYADDNKNVTGSAGGIGSNFFCVRKKYAYQSTIAHEIGHCFFLMHTSEPDPTEKGLDLMFGDRICDVAKAEPIELSKSDSCTYNVGVGIYTKEELNTVMCNIMSYSYLNCRKCISPNQNMRMRFYIHESPVMRMALKEIDD